MPFAPNCSLIIAPANHAPYLLSTPHSSAEARRLQALEDMNPPDSSHPAWQALYLVLLALPVSALSWTFTHEEIFREMREFCQNKSDRCRKLYQRKFFYIFTCEYCLSHYVAIVFIALTRFKFLLDWWMGYVISLFAVVAIANFYMSVFG